MFYAPGVVAELKTVSLASILAVGNILVLWMSSALSGRAQSVLPGWLWATAFIWQVGLGPVVVPALTIAAGWRDRRAHQTQAVIASAVAVATCVITLGLVEVGF